MTCWNRPAAVEIGRPDPRQVAPVPHQGLRPVHVGHAALDPHQLLAQGLGLDVVHIEGDGGNVDPEVALGLEQGRNQEIGAREELPPRDAEALGRKLVHLGEDGDAVRHPGHRPPHPVCALLKACKIVWPCAHGFPEVRQGAYNRPRPPKKVSRARVAGRP